MTDELRELRQAPAYEYAVNLNFIVCGLWKQTPNYQIQKEPICNISPIGDGAVELNYETNWGTASDVWMIDQDANTFNQEESDDAGSYDLLDVDDAQIVAIDIVRQLIPLSDEECKIIFMRFAEEVVRESKG